MISGLSMICADAPRMTVKTGDAHVWIDLSSGTPSPYQTESRMAIFVWGRTADVLQRATEAFNAIMDGATLLPVYPSTGGPTADLMTAGDPMRLAKRAENDDLARALDVHAARELEPAL